MKSPRHTLPYPDASLDCQEALEQSFQAVLDDAEAAGWPRSFALASLHLLIVNQSQADTENKRTQRQIDRSAKKL